MMNNSTLDGSETNDPFAAFTVNTEIVNDDPFSAFETGEIERDLEPGRNINPDRKRTVYTKPSKPKTRITKGGTQVTIGYTEEEQYEDTYDIRNVPVEYDDGVIGYLSYGEINNPDINPQLKRKIEEAKIANENLSFEPYEISSSPKTGSNYGSYDYFGTREKNTVYPYKEELDAITAEFTERKKNSEEENGKTNLSTLPEQFRTWEGEVPPIDLVQDYFKFQKNILDRQKAIDSEIDRAWAGFSDGERKAINIYNEDVRLKSNDAKTIKTEYDKLQIKATGISNGEDAVKIAEFEENIKNPDYKFNIPEGSEKLQLLDGRFISKEQYDDLQSSIHNYNVLKDDLLNQYEELLKRSEIGRDAQEELAISKLNFSMADKLGFQILDVGGGLLTGGMEYLEAGVNILRDLEGVSLPGGGSTLVYNPKEGNEFTFFEDYGQERRKRMDAERKKFRKDVDFDDAFDSLNNFGRFLFEESGRQLPIFAGMIATGGAASVLGAGTYLSAAAAGSVIGVQSAGQQIGDMTYQEYLTRLDDLDYNDKNTSDLHKMLVGTGFGLAEGALGVAPTFIIGKTALSGGFKTLLKNQSDDLTMLSGKQYFKKNAFKEFAIGAGLESTTEGLTSIFQNIFTGRPILENVDHAAFAGGFFGGVMGAGGVVTGAAARSMANKEVVEGILNNAQTMRELKQEYQQLKDNKLGRTKRAVEIRKELKELQDDTVKQIDGFNETWSAKMGYNVYEDFKSIVGAQYDLRAEALAIQARTDISEKKKETMINALSLKYKRLEGILDEFKSPDKYGNRFTLLKGVDPDRHDRILKQARKNLESEGKNTNESAINKEAELIYNTEQVAANKAAINKILTDKEMSLNYTSDIFPTEADAVNRANEELAKENLSKSERKYWESIKNAKKGTRNGIAARVNGEYRFATIEENEIKNSRTQTKTHETSHLILWDKVLKLFGDGRTKEGKAKKAAVEAAIANDIVEYLLKNQPRVYNDMFGFDLSQRVQVGEKGFIPAEIIAGFIERASQMDLSRPQDKQFMGAFGRWISGFTGIDRDTMSKPNDVIDFLITLGQKLDNGTLKKTDLDKKRIEEVFDKYKNTPVDDGLSIDEKADSMTDDKTLFEQTEDIINAVDWNKLSKDEKKDVGEMIGLYWENFIRKKFKQTMSVNTDDYEIDNLTSEFVLGEKSRSRGLAEIISRWNPNVGTNINQWIQSSIQGQGQVDLRILDFVKKSPTYGRFVDSIDEIKSSGQPFEISTTDSSLDINKTTQDFNEFRKLLNIEFGGQLYDKTLKVNTEMFLNLKDTKGKFKGKTVKELLDLNPRRARTIIQDYAAKNLRADITNIIGAQKSKKFKDFIRNEETLQSLINLIAVKHRSSFPFLSEVIGTMNVDVSKANQQSDQGQFVSDEKAGNKIYKPKDMSKMKPDEKAEFIDFVEKAFVDGLKIRGRGDKQGYVDKDGNLTGVVEYDGRETTHKALKDALANELILDATFTAMENSDSMQAMYDGVTGKLAENIKRDPELAFSVSEAGGLQKLTKLAKIVMKGDYDSVFDSKGVLNEKYNKEFTPEMAKIVQDIYESGLIQDQKVYKFLQAIQKNPAIPQEVKDQVKNALTSKSDYDLRKVFADDMEILANEFGAEILEVIGFDALGFINRVLDPAKTKQDKEATLSLKQTVAEDLNVTLEELGKMKEGKGLTVYQDGVTGDFYQRLQDIKSKLNNTKAQFPEGFDISKVRPMNIKIAGSLFFRIDKILQSDTTASEKIEQLLDEKLQTEIKEANAQNKILFKYLIKKLLKSGISDVSMINMLQLQTNAAEGFRALTGLKYITITDGPLGKMKGEHLADNSSTMVDIVELKYKNLKGEALDEAIDGILEYHDQWIGNRSQLDFVDVFGKNNPNKDLRIRLYPNPSQVFTFDMKPAETLIKQREDDIKLKVEQKKTKNARNTLEMANSLSGKRKGISVFDFDDTLAKSNSKVGVTMPDGSKRRINATEFALESADLEAAGAKFDFSEFNKVIDGKKGPLADLALKRQGKFGSGDIFVLTARPQEAAYAIHAFLKGIGLNIPIENITGLEDGRPQAKADWIINKVGEGYNDFYFADDAIKNIKAVKDALKDVDVKGRVELAFSESINYEDKINEIIAHQSGVSKDARFSRVVAQRKGKQSKFYILPSTAQDFEGLLYYMAGKGEQGSKDLAWLQNNLFKPYMKAVDAINIAKTSIISDFKKLNKNYKAESDKLTKLMQNGNFTYDQGIRVYIYNKQGQNIPGISKRDLNSILKEINSDPRLKQYADAIQNIGSGKDGVYPAPKDGWEMNSVLADLDNLTRKVGRKRFLEDWLKVIEATFTPDVFNKLEAIYGSTYVDALKDALWRMENGTNRPSGANATTNAWLNWVNNSVGTIMFFNRRSALLQGISFINFVNWSDNNPLKAAIAYGNQPQFWQDFAMIWNSPKLKQRRRGLQTDLQWQEIANAAKNSKNRFNSAISYLLQIGFTPTQLMDNFAIAAGGAPFYRNRFNTYKKQGLTDAEAKQKAFDDFSEIAEKTQQSGDPALISQEQASPLGRLVLAFQNVTQQMVRLQNKAGTMLIRRQKYEGMTQLQSDFTNVSKIVYYGAIQNFIFTFLQNAMFGLLPGFEGDEKDDLMKQIESENAKKARQINNMIDTLLRGSGLKGAVVSTIKNAIMQYQKQDAKGFRADHTYTLIELLNISPPIGSKARKVYSAIQTRKFNRDLLEERGFEITADGRINLAPSYEIIGNLASAFLNLPLDRVVSELDGIVEATDSRNRAWQRIALALGWRTWDVGAKNEEEDLMQIFIDLDKKQKKRDEKNKKKDPFAAFDN